MKVYFLKTDISQYVIYPAPDDESLYFVLDVESDDELAQKTPVLHQGKLVLVDKQPTPDHEWDGTAWVIPPEKMTALLAERKTQLLNVIANKTDNFKAQYLVGYSQAEIDSFYRQEREARNELPTMLLTEIFEGRDDLSSIEYLKKKVIEKADLFAIIMGKLFAIKQGFEKHIEQAETMEQLDKIEQEINQWQKL
nr:phage tail protein [uncultured Aggregatibacter sp.]